MVKKCIALLITFYAAITCLFYCVVNSLNEQFFFAAESATLAQEIYRNGRIMSGRVSDIFRANRKVVKKSKQNQNVQC